MNDMIDVKVKDKGNYLIIELIKDIYTDTNKWDKEKVLCDRFIKRCIISKIKLRNLGIRNHDYEMELLDIVNGNQEFVTKLIDNSESMMCISFSLPTNTYSHTRGLLTSIRRFKDSFLPIIVLIDTMDVSRQFEDFDVYNEEIIEQAYNSIFNEDKFKNVQGELIDYSSVYKLKKEINKEDNKIINKKR